MEIVHPRGNVVFYRVATLAEAWDPLLKGASNALGLGFRV